MNPNEQLQLNNMIKEHNVEDSTADIQKKQHSGKIRDDVTKMVDIIKDNDALPETELDELLISKCPFLFTYYTDLFNRIKKKELNLSILWDFINTLEKIEKGEIDQHMGSFEVGKLLKKIYIDSALQKANKLNPEKERPKKISWKTYKNNITP